MTGRPFAELIGDPVGHSRSPLIHHYWMERRGFQADYRALRLGADDLGQYLEDRRGDPDWRGCNVTRPHKERIVALADRLDSEAEATGAVNILVPRSDGTLIGRNSDVHGVRAALGSCVAPSPRVAIIGAGGAARAAVRACLSLDPESLTLLCRRRAQGEALLSKMDLAGSVLGIGSIPAADLLINASPLNGPWELSALPDHALVFDMAYDPPDTGLLRAARRRGMRSVDGLEMLMHQASLAFAAFFGGTPPPVDGALRDRIAA